MLYIKFNKSSFCLFCTEIKQASAMKVCFQIAECRQSFAKIVQTSAMKTCFQIAECRQSCAKIHHFFVNRKRLRAFFSKKSIQVSFFLVILHSEK